MEGSVEAYVGLGANVGVAPMTLERAVASIAALPGATLSGVSRLYRTRPVGLLEQPDFSNAVVGLRLAADDDPVEAALTLLGDLKRIERDLGRQERERWGPREIDLDLLLFGPHSVRAARSPAARSADPRRAGEQWLEVPHPEAARRLFVLAPWAELAPDLRPPGWVLSVAAARDRAVIAEGKDAVQAVATWEGDHWRWLDAP